MSQETVQKERKRIVVKVGTSTLTYPAGLINVRVMERLVKVLSDLKNARYEIILVTSAAISVGAGMLGLKERPSDVPTKQATAAVGQCELMHLYGKMFAEYNHTVAQILMTRDVTDHPDRLENVRNTFMRLLDLGALPIVNENDTVAVEELKFGDNDALSAQVAQLTGADILIILSDIDGLYTANPTTNPDATLIPRVEQIDDYIESIAAGTGSNRGTGGMVTKIHAAKLATEAGIDMTIINGKNPESIYTVLEGGSVGTFFAARP